MELAEIQKKYHKDLLIETFATVPPDKTDAFGKMDKPARAKFFQSWANDRAKKERVEGVYVLILKQPGHVQVEVGHETQKPCASVFPRIGTGYATSSSRISRARIMTAVCSRALHSSSKNWARICA